MLPQMRTENIVAAADRCAFVRDSFSWGAFFFGPLWLLRHRLVVRARRLDSCRPRLAAASYWIGLSGGVRFLVFGRDCPLSRARRRHSCAARLLRRRGFDLADIVASDRRDDAERIFYTRWLAPGARRSEAPAPLFGLSLPRGPGERVIGMFPDAEA